jgi:hypothetical protein
MTRRRISLLAALALSAAFSTHAVLATAAENFVCGPGGKPDAKTSKCICPAGLVEKTTGGTSRCVGAPKPPAATTTATSPTIVPTTPPPPAPTTTATTDVPPPPPMGTVEMPPESPTPPPSQAPPTSGPELGYVPVGAGTSTNANAPLDDEPLTPRPYKQQTSDLHTYLEMRLGAATMLQQSSGYGPSLDVSYGMGFSWVDVGIVGRFASIPMKDTDGSARQFSIGPEIATRTFLGGPMTFRLGVDPLYTLETFNGQTHSLVGVDGLAQFLFTIDDTTRPVWRLGLGFHGGRRWPTSGGDGIWMVGADVIVRTWW